MNTNNVEKIVNALVAKYDAKQKEIAYKKSEHEKLKKQKKRKIFTSIKKYCA